MAKAKATVNKAPRGRPTKYSAVWVPKLGELMAESGMIDVGMAKRMGIAESTFHKWKKDHPEFCNALKKGKAGVNESLVSSLFRAAQGYFVDETTVYTDADGEITSTVTTSKWVRADSTALIFSLTNRDPENWKRLKQVEVHNTYDDAVTDLADAIRSIK